MEKLVLFIDLDGTLKSEHDYYGPFEVPTITIQSGKNSYTFAQRPNLHTFLDIAKQKAELVLTTAAGGGYARKALAEMNISDYFSKIIAAEDYRNRYNFRCGWKYILIDNDTKIADLKVQALKGFTLSSVDLSVWIIDTYLGSKNDNTLLELKEEIEKL